MTTVESHSDVTQPVPSEKSSLGIVEFGFHAKTSFDADDALLLTRSEKFRLKPPPRDDDIWKRPPPDFRYVVYAPNPPTRNTRDSQQPWLYGTYPGQRTTFKREPKSLLPIIFRSAEPTTKEFVTRFHIARPFTAKKEFVRDGMNVPGEYIQPKHHDFRGYPPIQSLGLPEFLTDYEKDPYNIKFHTKNLRTICGAGFGCTERDLVEGRQMGRPKTPQPPYDAGLILYREQWPQPQAAFTRYRRRNRQPYSAFMERVETTLNAQWAKEQLEKALQERELKQTNES
ncbi:uncharacterized protein LOC121381263 [Gigantopelta aegis]|uniref:uncharacterized protein LOC121381263 n=1 Tax=Gigantopelta aegis TaxID=1735272 RepID=UPI001B88CE3B|nr:uncharacterized protein LOC121381263 [Gigantopelta aegis]